ncbi:LysR substrate-binding domain-containing protein [Bacillus paramycoides]|uniref:LysR substrate-binding domain-containing protein n=1 Tax=Bacillus paramycoides TaxID=2026194 RepID=UPI003D04D11C
MNIIQLQYLVDVGELGSITEAAKKNGMTVPAISISISQLETELEVSLFSRSRKGVIPTTEGKKVIQHAITILKTVDKMKYDISLSKNIKHGNIIIATIPGLVRQVINTTLEFRKIYPYINVQMVEGDTTVVLDHVKNGHADMGFVSFGTNNHDETLRWEPVMRDEAVLVVPKSSALQFNNSISNDDIKNETIVLYNDPYVKIIAEKLFLDDLTNRIALISNNLEALLQMVVHGNAITIATNYIVHSLPSHIRNKIITISINEHTTLSNYLWRLTRKNAEVSNLIEQFTSNLLSDLKRNE